jgi:hypothetical protein
MTEQQYKTSFAEGEVSPSAIPLSLRELEPVIAEASAFADALVIISEDARPHPNTIAVLSVELQRRMGLIRQHHNALLNVIKEGRG